MTKPRTWSSHPAAGSRPPQLWACLHCLVRDSPLLLPHTSPAPLSPALVHRTEDDIPPQPTLSLLISPETLMVGRENPVRSSGHCREPGLTAWGLGKASQAVRHRWAYEVGPEAQTTTTTTPGCQGPLAVHASRIL